MILPLFLRMLINYYNYQISSYIYIVLAFTKFFYFIYSIQYSDSLISILMIYLIY